MRFCASNLEKETKLALIADENYPFERIEKMIKKNEETEVILAAIGRNDVTVEFLEKFVNHDDYRVRKEIAKSDKISSEALEKLSRDLINDVVISAISNPEFSNCLLEEKISGIGIEYSTNIILPLVSNSHLSLGMLNKLYDIFLQADNKGELYGCNRSIIHAFWKHKISSDYILREIYKTYYGYLDDDFLIETLVANNRSYLIDELIFSDFSKIRSVFWCEPKNISLLPEDLFYKLWNIYISSYINWENNILYEFITSPYLRENMIEEIISRMLDLLNYENYRILVRNFKLIASQLNTLWIKYNIRKEKDIDFVNSPLILYDFLENPNTDEKIKNYIRSIL